MRTLFISGSVIPFSWSKKRSEASTTCMSQFFCFTNSSITSSASLARNSPVSTKMQVRFSPIAWWTSAAATALSTPPLSPHITEAVPTRVRISEVLVSIKLAGVQSQES